MPDEKELQKSIDALTKELHELMQGTPSRDAKGIFKRLTDVEQASRHCEEQQQKQIETLKKEIREEITQIKNDFRQDFKEFELEQEQSFNLINSSVEKISTAVSNLATQINSWKGIIDVFNSKWFWAVLAFVASGRFIYWIVEAYKAANK